MKKLLGLFTALLLTLGAFAQTPEEIISRMEKEMEKHYDEGIVMTVDFKVPLLGNMTTKTYAKGDRLYLEGKMTGVDVVSWTDGVTEWTYNAQSNEVVIKNSNGPASQPGDAEIFSGISFGYDVFLKEERNNTWHLQCKKSKSNKNKEDPKTIRLVIEKGTYHPLSLSTRMSGVLITLHDISFGVSDERVTFNPEDYPTATIIDKR